MRYWANNASVLALFGAACLAAVGCSTPSSDDGTEDGNVSDAVQADEAAPLFGVPGGGPEAPTPGPFSRKAPPPVQAEQPAQGGFYGKAPPIQAEQPAPEPFAKKAPPIQAEQPAPEPFAKKAPPSQGGAGSYATK